ncbi:MAG TPA: DHA2 family efflux MFS transporter permease subunit [Thermomicrobiaceae bacterium]|nr:DHA2 family efflux MFS transporter permease subunit [Thermomicrobiaceae bacterium]
MPGRHLNQKVIVAVVYVCGMLMNSIDSTIVNVALATLSRQFNVPPASIDAVVVSYLVSLAVFVPAAGWLGDRWGTRRIFLIALALFTGASALCGLSTAFGELILFRALQGAGGGMLTPVGLAMLYRTFPPEERVQVGRILMFVTILGPATGPVIGGLLVEKLSWHWAFFVNVPVGSFAFLVGLLFLSEHREPLAGRFDLPGFLLAGSGFASVMYALSEGPSRGWTSPGILGSAAVGAVVLAIFVVVELRTREPMVKLSVLTDRLFRSTTMTSMFGSAGFMGVLFLVPLFLQEARGASPLSTGLTTFPEAIGVVTSTQLVAHIYPRIGPRRLMCGGLVWVATMMALLCTIGLGTSAWVVRGLMFLIGAGMAYVFLPSQVASFATISRAATGRAATLSSVQRYIGGATGVALLSSVFAAVGATVLGPGGLPQPNLNAYHVAFLAAAGLALLASLIALTIPDRDAAATMRVGGGGGGAREPAEERVLADVG